MARRNISLPDDLDEDARRARLNVSALAQRAISEELERRSRMSQLDAWLDELDAEHGAPAEEAVAEAKAWLASATPAGGRRTSHRRVAAAKATERERRAAG